MATSIVWVSAMRWKECQPIFKCHSLLFWIPALLCATDLNWVNITCGAPLGPSVHARVCECMHVCEHGNECFKPRLLAFHRMAPQTLQQLCCTLPCVRLKNCNLQWLKTFPGSLSWVDFSLFLLLFFDKAEGWRVQRWGLRGCDWHHPLSLRYKCVVCNICLALV